MAKGIQKYLYTLRNAFTRDTYYPLSQLVGHTNFWGKQHFENLIECISIIHQYVWCIHSSVWPSLIIYFFHQTWQLFLLVSKSKLSENSFHFWEYFLMCLLKKHWVISNRSIQKFWTSLEKICLLTWVAILNLSTESWITIWILIFLIYSFYFIKFILLN